MLNPRWHKVIGDLVENKTRTALVVMALAVGVFTFGLVGNAQVIIDREIQEGVAASNPADITLTLSAFDKDLIHAVEGPGGWRGRPDGGRASLMVYAMVDHQWLSSLDNQGRNRSGGYPWSTEHSPTPAASLERIGMVTDFAPGDAAHRAGRWAIEPLRVGVAWMMAGLPAHL
jgi:hypothetical protein